ncbi:hypothetical protein [Nonomuraea sp. NPDC001023]|uniref:DUF7064 domain-containing protein n=1 Tax=unclassified Nonomuraea TaxID=2593643 RepID=UPI00331949CC
MRIVNMGDWPLGEQDEQLHPPGDDPLWNESYYLDFVADDGELGGYVRIGLYPNWKRTWFWARLVRRGGGLVEITDHEAPPTGLTISADAYEADLAAPGPLRTARLRLAAPGLSLDLEWHTRGGVYGYQLTPRYEIPCEVTGTVDGRPFHGHGERDHSWGVRDWWSLSWTWSSGRLSDGTHLHGTQVNLGMPLPWPAFTVPPGGGIEHADGFTAGTRFDGDRPAETLLSFPGRAVTVRPVAFAPVTLVSPDGAVAEFPRALCELESDDGGTGFGWTEWHQPPGWRRHGWHPLL